MKTVNTNIAIVEIAVIGGAEEGVMGVYCLNSKTS